MRESYSLSRRCCVCPFLSLYFLAANPLTFFSLPNWLGLAAHILLDRLSTLLSSVIWTILPFVLTTLQLRFSFQVLSFTTLLQTANRTNNRPFCSALSSICKHTRHSLEGHHESRFHENTTTAWTFYGSLTNISILEAASTACSSCEQTHLKRLRFFGHHAQLSHD